MGQKGSVCAHDAKMVRKSEKSDQQKKIRTSILVVVAQTHTHLNTQEGIHLIDFLLPFHQLRFVKNKTKTPPPSSS